MVGRQCRCLVPFTIVALSSCTRFGHAFTIFSASTPKSALRFCKEYNLRRRSSFSCNHGLAMMSSTANTFAKDEVDFIPRLYGNTLVLVQTIALLNHEQEQQQHHALVGNKSSSKVVFVDGSWYHRPNPITNLPRNPTQDFISGPRLPAARYLDIDALATTYELFPDDNPMNLPHMMPPPTLFRLAMDAYNIRNKDHVVIYARRGALFTPRVWFLFSSMGHDDKRLHLMQGSLEDYVDVGGVVETGEYHHSSTVIENQYIECFNRGILNVTRLHLEYSTTTIPRYNVRVPTAMNICNKDVVLAALSNGDVEKKNTVIIDTRGSGYAKDGHMPMAIHLPYTQISTSNALVIQSVSLLKKLFEDRQIDYLDPALKIILSCGSGVSVCHVYLALKELGRNITEENTLVYDGSWAEWGNLEIMYQSW